MSDACVGNEKKRKGTSEEEKYPVLFRWMPEASAKCQQVKISGSFNKWGEKISLKEEHDAFGRGKLFSTIIELPPGTHTFKFLVNNQWKYNPEVAFVLDEFGNYNNFIDVKKTTSRTPQTPIKTILRDVNSELPEMNPLAIQEASKIRSGRGDTSPEYKSGSSERAVHASGADLEFGLDVQPQRHSLQIAPRSMGGFKRSKSDVALDKLFHEKATIAIKEHPRKFHREVSASILLAARTQHFGGDLVTHEHHQRQQEGGNKSLITRADSSGEIYKSGAGKLIILLVGLPGRGKTFLGRILARHLTWIGHETKIFNVGEYRRRIAGAELPHDFWNPVNKESLQKRAEIAKECLHDALNALLTDSSDCVIYDGTNATIERRRLLEEEISNRCDCGVLFIESMSNETDAIESSIHEMQMNSDDYRNKSMEEAVRDYIHRIGHYQSIYESLNESELVSFIQIINYGKQIFCNMVQGYLQSKIMFLVANLNLKPRPIWLSRHGESIFNTQGRIGGDSGLSPLGLKYAEQLDRFIDAHYPQGTDLAVWTSTMKRTGLTTQRMSARGRTIVKWKQLDEIDAGLCDGMTYTEVAEQMPDEYLARTQHKLHYRYPRGESYQDVIHRLEPVITEMMRQTRPLLIVAHQAILRVLYGYLTNKNPNDCATIDMPLHALIQLTPKAYHCEEVWHYPM